MVNKINSKDGEMTGRIKIRETSGIFFGKKLVLQVEMESSGDVPEWDREAPFTWWVDAQRSHLEQLPATTLKCVLSKSTYF